MKNILHPRLQLHIKDKGWNVLRDIQIQAFDPIYSGESCVLEAPTSGGKTEAVLFPLLSRISREKRPGIRVLYLAPLKALLNDIELRVDDYAEACGLTAFKWHGDVSQTNKIQQLLTPSEILLTTPESLEAILLRKSNWPDLFHNLDAVVIDEAHYFALSDRGVHLMALLERLDFEINASPQRIAMTATVGNPDNLLQWMQGKKRSGGRLIVVKAKTQKQKDFKVHYFDEDDENSPSRNDALYKLLFNKKSIVFCNSRTGTETSAKFIIERNKRLTQGLPIKVRTHHSSVSKYLRELAEGLIKARSEGDLNAIISTSTLELGIDIGELDQVVQIGESNSSGSFLQRVGRTGRREGKAQSFRGLCSDEDQLILLSACISLGLKGISEKILFSKRAYHILAHQIICLCLQKMGITADRIWEILSNSYSFANISRKKFQDLIDFMVKEDFLRSTDDDLLLTSNRTESMFLKANWKRLFASFDTGPMYNVVDGKKIIGTLDCNFVRMQEVPFLFILGGIEWKATKVNHDAQHVSVTKNTEGNSPKWQTPRYSDTPFEVAQEAGKLLVNNPNLDFLDVHATKVFCRLSESYCHIGWNTNTWVIDDFSNKKIFLWTFAGDKINRTISFLLKKERLGKVLEDYQKIEISFSKKSEIGVHDIINFLKAQSAKSISEFTSDFKTDAKSIKFSKFSICLPDQLSEEAIFDRALDISGTLQILKSISFKLLADD